MLLLNAVALLVTSFSVLAQPALLVAHKSITNVYDYEASGCPARSLKSLEVNFVENTLPALREAFRLGADAVEFDLRLTKDNELVVFHDETLDCLTDGSGTVRSKTLAELRKLNVAHGYSADGGKTFPWRRTPLRISTLEEILREFPHRRLMYNPKDDDPEVALAMARVFRKFPRDLRKDFYWGSGAVFHLLGKLTSSGPQFIPNHWVMDRCLAAYSAIGWTGIWPKACEIPWIVVDGRIRRWNFWGWPGTFIDRAHEHKSKVWVFGVGTREDAAFYTLTAEVIMPTYLWKILR